MNITISISELRNNIATYLEKAASGINVSIRDEKRGSYIAQIIGTHSFSESDYEKVLLESAGTLSDTHTEWKNRSSVNKWLRQTRKQSDRKI